MKHLFLSLGAVAARISCALAGVSNVTFDANGERARIRYRLAEDAIITAEVRTNGAAVAAADFSTATGDVNRLVPAGQCQIEWVLPPGLSRASLKDAEAVLTSWPTNAPPRYLVIDLVASNTAYYASADALPHGGLTNDLYRTSRIAFVRIPAAGHAFTVGSPKAVHNSTTSEAGRETVLSQDFWMGVFEVTQKQYENVMGDNPGYWTNADDSAVRPFDRATFARFRGNGNWPSVRTVSDDSFCGRLGAISGIRTFDLPTGAQWEFACKAFGSLEAPNGAVYDSNGSYLTGHIDAYAWTKRNSKVDDVEQPRRAGGLQPNAFGLYDMLGNVWEWVLDYAKPSGSDYVPPEIDPAGPPSGTDGKRLMRGGAFNETMDKCRSSFAIQSYYPNLAFSDQGKYGVRPVCTFRPAYTPVVPEGTGVRWRRDPTNGMVSVAYDLAEDAIVTCEISTNGVPLDPSAFTRLSGAVNRLVAAGTDRVFRWMPDPSMTSPDDDCTLSVAVKAWSPDAPPDYLAVDLTVTNRQLYYVSEAAIPHGIGHERYKSGIILMRRIPASGVTFRMGSVTGESDRDAEAEIPHYVTLTNDYYMAIYETTIKQHYNICGAHQCSYINCNIWTNSAFSAHHFDLTGPSNLRGTGEGCFWPTNHAVDAGSVIGKLRSIVGDDRFDLPTEAQWEFAARAGSSAPLGREGVSLDDVAWTFLNTPAPGNGGYWHPTCEVGLKTANGLGLYDTLGNAGELCLDAFAAGERYSDGGAVVDPRGPVFTNRTLVVRGGDVRSGDYRYSLSRCRTAARAGTACDTGKTAFGSGYRLIRFIGPMPGPFINENGE